MKKKKKNNLNVELKRVNLEFGAAYFQNRNYKKAKKILTKTLTYPDLPPVARKNVNNLLKIIEDIKTFGGSVTLGVTKNDNINSVTYLDTIELLGQEFKTSAPVEAKVFNDNVSLYKKFFLNKNFDINLTANYANIHYTDNRNLDVRVFSPKITTTFTSGNYESTINGKISKIYFAHKSFSNNYSTTISHQYNFSNYFIPKYSFTLTKKDLQGDNAALEGISNQHDLNLKFNIIVKNSFYGYIAPYYSRSDNNLAEAFNSYFSNKYGILYVQKIPLKTLLFVNYYQQNNKYDARHPFDSIKEILK